MPLEIISNLPLFSDTLADASSNAWSWNVATDAERAEKLKFITGLLKNIPFMGTYSDIFENGWSFIAWISIFRDAILFGLLGWTAAWWWERQGLLALAKREEELLHVRVEAGPKTLSGDSNTSTIDILNGSIVLSHDMFRSFTIFIRKVFGGNIKHYERLLTRARREAIVRLKEDAIGQGFERVINLKIVTTNIKGNGPRRVEVLAYGTGVYS